MLMLHVKQTCLTSTSSRGHGNISRIPHNQLFHPRYQGRFGGMELDAIFLNK